MDDAVNENMVPVKVWDLPVRVIHWSLVVLVAVSWLTAEIGQLALHHLSGYLIFALVVARVVWGFVGSTTARFTHFVKGPAAVKAYAASLFNRAEVARAGHNPLGALSVLVLLGLLGLQVLLGLFAQDSDGLGPGPLADHLSRQTGRAIAEVHEAVFGVLLIFIALHVAAILFHTCYKRDTLLGPMMTGRKMLPPESVKDLHFASAKWAALTFIFALIVVVFIAAV